MTTELTKIFSEKQLEKYSSLTTMQKEFVQARVTGLPPLKAAMQTSSKASSREAYRVMASKFSNDPDIKELLDTVDRANLDAAIMSREEALCILTNIGSTSLSDFIEFKNHVIGKDEKGNDIIQAAWSVKDPENVPPEILSVIAELSATKDGIKIKLHSPLQAIKQIGEMQDWEAPKKILTTEAMSLSDFYSDQAQTVTDS